ncbi:hypothetical protein ABID70_002003 [Clavibacter michiganensis]|uniref:DUF2087 domain-containing protein n=1 Tax=Clavibacter michiganensis TaxID=28447 RepID=UPI001AE17A3A|nr:DUF2087 domain-containing protein [Clavibacter michiganensis]MBP2456481.1 hypothetical protein [Clavibacter michiganensis]MDQ0409051.1 hypothetical protein [Clavibacter michiganensis]
MDRIDPRRLAGVLADAELRAAYARVVLGSGLDEALAHLSPARRSKARASLVGSGLVAVDADGTASAPDAVFRAILAQQPATPPAHGVERFLRDGRIAQWPASPADLDALLRHVVAQALDAHEVLDEKALTARLLRITDDHALLRRHLVDAGLVLRTRSGSEYARADATADPDATPSPQAPPA